MKNVLRHAEAAEVALMAKKLADEESAVRSCHTKVTDRALPMKLLDAEYQFDRHKLTFFFEAERRIDFRELVRDLFASFKTRIWMQQVVEPSINLEGLGKLYETCCG